MLVICCSSLFIVGLDSTIVNVALPSIGRDLHASVAGLQWTIDGYALVLASFLMRSGATADRVGRRDPERPADVFGNAAQRDLAAAAAYLAAHRVEMGR